MYRFTYSADWYSNILVSKIAGLIVKPQYFSGPFQMGLWTAPGRFAFEGITMSQFSGVTATVLAEPSSPYFFLSDATKQWLTPESLAMEQWTTMCCFTLEESSNQATFG